MTDSRGISQLFLNKTLKVYRISLFALFSTFFVNNVNPDDMEDISASPLIAVLSSKTVTNRTTPVMQIKHIESPESFFSEKSFS